jgi:hypothetical protein
MPNWCSNSLTVIGDKEYIDNMAAAFAEGKLLNFIKPVADSEDWYAERVAAWGTKWDIGGENASCWVEQCEGDQWIFNASFDSAWAPPVNAYQALVDKGIEVRAYYYEPGMNFCGMFDSNGDEYYDILGDSEWVVENIPEEIDITMGISENMEMYEEDEE